MSSKNYLSVIALTAFIGWITLAIVVFRLDPFTSTTLALPFFFLALFFALSTTLALTGFYSRVWFRTNEIYQAHIPISLRQGILISIAVCVTMVFQIHRMLTWWDGILIVAAVSLVELYFSSQD